jgi:signal transduction histidine kinase
MLARLDAAPATRSAVLDVVAEALTNAVRHGAARTVDVRLDPRPEGRLLVIVRDDGRASSAGAPGMGSRLLDAVAISWTLAGVEHGTELRAELSLDPHRGALPTRV